MTLLVFGIVGAQATSSDNAHVRGVVLFAGDSNFMLDVDQLVWDTSWRADTDNGFVPVIAARVGSGIRTFDCRSTTGCTTTLYWQTRLSELFTRVHPDAVVVDLGINDAKSYGTDATTPGYAFYMDKLAWWQSLVPADVPILWTNLPCAIEPIGFQYGCKWINNALWVFDSRSDQMTMLNWAVVANTHPEWIIPGDVHYTDAGNKAFAQFIANALNNRFPAI